MDQELQTELQASSRAYTSVGWTLHVHSPDGNTFAWNDVMAAILKYVVI